MSADQARSVEEIQKAKASIQTLLDEVKALRARVADLEGSLIYEIKGLLSTVSELEIKILSAMVKEQENKAEAIAQRDVE